MSEEEKEAIEYWKTHMEILHCNTQIASEHYIKVLLDLVEKQQKEIEKRIKEIDSLYKIMSAKDDEIEELKEDNNALEMMIDTANAREYRKKYIEERRKEQPNLYYPDFDEIYERYYKQKKEIEELSIIKNTIQTLETDFVNDNTYYVIAKENFLEGDFRHLLDDYISKDKIKEKIKEVENREENYTFDKLTSEDIRRTIITNLEELLGE